MQDTQHARLLRLRYVMGEIAKPRAERADDIGPVLKNAHFDIGVVGMKRGEGYVCGCVVGLSSLDPVLQEEGLVGHFEYRGEIGAQYMALTLDGVPVVFSEDRLAHFFGISLKNYHCLVDPSAYEARGGTRPSAVLSRIDRLIAGKEIEADPFMPMMIQSGMIRDSRISGRAVDSWSIYQPVYTDNARERPYVRYEMLTEIDMHRVRLAPRPQDFRYVSRANLERSFIDPSPPPIERAVVRERELVDA